MYTFTVVSGAAGLFGYAVSLVVRTNTSTGVSNVVAVADSAAEAGRIRDSLNLSYV